MRVTYSPVKRFLILLLALALLLTALPQALAEGNFEAVVSVDGMKVYAQAKPHDVLTTLPRGTVVTVLAWSGKAALISSGGVTGVARGTAHMIVGLICSRSSESWAMPRLIDRHAPVLSAE